MARARTIRIGALNIRVHTRHAPDEYVAFWKMLVRLKAVKARGVSALMIGGQRQITPNQEDSPFFGYIYRFVNINPEDPWFDIERQKKADPADVLEVKIPAKLKPNLQEIPYLFDPKRHRLYFATSGSDGGVSPGLMKSLIDEVGTYQTVIKRFGDIESTVVVREGVLDELLRWPQIRDIRVVLERPNPTEFDDDEEFYERLKRRGVKKEEHRFIKSPEAKTITPDEEMVAMFGRATTDGLYIQRGINPEGKVQTATSEEYPRIEVGNYDPDQQFASDAFIELVQAKFKH